MCGRGEGDRGGQKPGQGRGGRWRACALFSAISLCAALAGGAELRDIRPIVAADYTRLVLDLGESVTYRTQRSAANAAAGVPERLVLDLQHTRLPGAQTIGRS